MVIEPSASEATIFAKLADGFGFVPPFYRAAAANSSILQALYEQTRVAYLENPIPPVLKEKLTAYLSRNCAVPYCLVCHSCQLVPRPRRTVLSARRLSALPDASPEFESDGESQRDAAVLGDVDNTQAP